jgi:hypothetical protein
VVEEETGGDMLEENAEEFRKTPRRNFTKTLSAQAITLRNKRKDWKVKEK